MASFLEPVTSYNPESGESVFTLTDGVFNFVGTAKCHEDDMDLGNELTGMQIASTRAFIKALQHDRETVLAIVNALKHVIATMSMSPQFNPNSYEAKRIYQELQNAEHDLHLIRLQIQALRDELRTYIQNKDKSYKVIRANRAKKN